MLTNAREKPCAVNCYLNKLENKQITSLKNSYDKRYSKSF